MLPPGVSRLDFLELVNDEFQKASQRPLIVEDELRNWLLAQSLEDTYASPYHIGVEIQKPSNSPQKREKHEADLLQQGREMASQEDTAVAFAAYWLKTRSDLFEDSGVQTNGRGLQLNEDGLVEVEFFKTVAVAVADARGKSVSEKACQSRLSLFLLLGEQRSHKERIGVTAPYSSGPRSTTP
jgi:hypothetical protein